MAGGRTMSFDLPPSVESDLQAYAQAEHISPAEAVVKFVQSGLKARRRKSAKGELTAEEWLKVKEADPGFAFFAKLPDSVIDRIAEASKQTRGERFTPRA
jgi:hypothetical protein